MARRPRSRRQKRKKQEGGSTPWGAILGVGVALGSAYGAYRMFSAPAAAPAPAPPAPQYAPQPQPYYPPQQPMQPGTHGMSGFNQGPVRDIHGIPTINLPAESAARTQQARLFMPQRLPDAPLPIGQSAGNMQGTMVEESFGGSDDNGMGGEKF